MVSFVLVKLFEPLLGGQKTQRREGCDSSHFQNFPSSHHSNSSELMDTSELDTPKSRTHFGAGCCGSPWWRTDRHPGPEPRSPGEMATKLGDVVKKNMVLLIHLGIS